MRAEEIIEGMTVRTDEIRSMGINEASEHDEELEYLMRYLKSYLLDRQYDQSIELVQEINWMDRVPHDLKPLLDRNKDGLLKRFLEFIKYSSSGKYISPSMAGFDASNTVIGLRKLGVDWPELDAIENSFKPKKKKRIREDLAGSERDTTIEEIVDAMTNGGSIRTFRYARNAIQKLDSIGQDMLEDEMIRKKSSITANLLDMFFDANPVDLDALVQLIDSSPARWPEIRDLPSSFLPIVEREFNERARYNGLADVIDDAAALSENGFDFEHLMEMIRGYHLQNAVASYATDIHAANIGRLGRDLSAMLELGVDGAELIPILEKRKNNIIRQLLLGMKSSQHVDVNRLLSALRETGIDWTELSAIEKSLSVIE